MRCEVVAIGTELLLGQIVDTNSSWIGEQLALSGIDSLRQTKVGDNLDRIVGDVDHALTVYWQVPNPDPGNQADAWTLYNGDGALPGPAPSYGAEVYVGLITYAYELQGVPFVGTCDALEGGAL